MPNTLNGSGNANAKARISAGDVDKTSAWNFSADDGNKLLGAAGDDWASYSKWHLGVDTAAKPDTKAHYKYPFGKNGKVYRGGLVSAKQRAEQQGDAGIENAASRLIDQVDGKALKPEPNRSQLHEEREAFRLGEKTLDLQRAYATLEIKSIADDGQQRIIEGVASTPATDRMGDIVEPMGAVFAVPMPLLWQHDSQQPVGWVTFAKPTANGIPYRAEFAKAGIAPFIDEAWNLVKAKLVRAVSIGFRPLDWAWIDETDWSNMGMHFLQWEWLELSAVTIPANMQATIATIKTFDISGSNGQCRASAASGTVSLRVAALPKSPPGVAGKPKGNHAMPATHAERISSWEAKRATLVAAMGNIMKVAEDDGDRTLTPEESDEHDRMSGEVAQVDAHVKRLRDDEQVNRAAAKPVPAAAGSDPDTASRVRAGDGVMRANANLPKGIGMARYVKALAFAKGNHQQAIEYAKQWETSTPEVIMALKSAVAAGTTQDSAWAGPLVYNQNLVNEFVEFLRPQTILGKMNGFRRVPFNVRFPTQTAGSTIGWVGEGKAKPVSKLQLSSGSLGFAKVAGIVIVTMELARFSSPSAEMLVRDDMSAQMIQYLDQQFIDPGVAAVANVNPASVTNGAGNVVQAAAVWSSQSNVITDIKGFLQAFAAQNIALDSTCYWIMTPAVAISLSMITTANGVYAFPDVGVNGGMLFGIPVITSNSVPNSVSAGAIVALVKASEIFLADDNQVAIDVSQEASLQMDSAPTEDATAPTATSVVSMFQTNSMAIRAERVINWSRRRSYGVGYVDNVHTS